MTNNSRKWYIFDAKEEVLGRLATQIAVLLRGKDKVEFDPRVDCGDSVVVTNARHIVLTGSKNDQKKYYKHTGYLGNLKVKTVSEVRENNPEFIIKEAVRGMLPKNKIAKDMLKRLHVFAENDHTHTNIKFENAK